MMHANIYSSSKFMISSKLHELHIIPDLIRYDVKNMVNAFMSLFVCKDKVNMYGFTSNSLKAPVNSYLCILIKNNINNFCWRQDSDDVYSYL